MLSLSVYLSICLSLRASLASSKISGVRRKGKEVGILSFSLNHCYVCSFPFSPSFCSVLSPFFSPLFHLLCPTSSHLVPTYLHPSLNTEPTEGERERETRSCAPDLALIEVLTSPAESGRLDSIESITSSLCAAACAEASRWGGGGCCRLSDGGIEWWVLRGSRWVGAVRGWWCRVVGFSGCPGGLVLPVGGGVEWLGFSRQAGRQVG